MSAWSGNSKTTRPVPTPDEALADLAVEVREDGTPEQRTSTLVLMRDRAYQMDRYMDRPVGFVEKFMPSVDLAPYQAEALEMIGANDRVSLRGPHGLGKTTIMSIATWWFAITREYAERDWKIATTASVHTQLRQFLWPEINKWAHAFDWAALGRPEFSKGRELLETEIHLSHGRAFALASNNPALIEGAHADSMMYVFDESKSIDAGVFDAAEGAFSTAGESTYGEAKAVAVSTPGDPAGRFYDIQSRKPGYEDWTVRHVTKEEALDAGRIAEEWVEQRGKQWGVESAIYHNRVLGEFHSADEDSVIPLRAVEAAVERWRGRKAGESVERWRPEPGEEEIEGTGAEAFAQETIRLGVDVARGGSDRTQIAILVGRDFVEEFRTRPFEPDLMKVAGDVSGILRARGGTAVVDVIGIGAGVYDRLREQGLSVIAFNAAAKSERFDESGEIGFINLRAEAWWNLRTILLEPDATLALPPDDELIGDLVAPRWSLTSGGRIKIESKDEIRKRLGRSTDKGDALIQALFIPLPAEIKLPAPVASTAVEGFGDLTRR